MSEPTPTIYESVRGGHARERVAGAVLSPEQGHDIPADAVTAVFVTDATLGQVRPATGDRYRDPQRRWWVVVVSAPIGDGGFRLDCTREGGA